MKQSSSANLNRKLAERATKWHPTASRCCLHQTMERELRASQRRPKPKFHTTALARSRASSSLTAPKGYKVPHSTTEDSYRGASRPTPRASEVITATSASGPRSPSGTEPAPQAGPPYSMCREVKSTGSIELDRSVDFRACRSGFPDFRF